MPWQLLKYGFKRSHDEPRFFPEARPLKKHYDVVIIGGGGHGMACAYYLAKDHGITDVAVLEQGYIGGGNTGRNTTIVRSNYLTPEGVKFYDTSVKLFEDLADDFDLNIFYSTRGHFTLAHTDSALRTMRWRAEVNKHLGVASDVVDLKTLAEEVPYMDLTCAGHSPVMGALYHAPGAVARHDAVAWGYARGAYNRGVELHQKTRVLNIRTDNGRVCGVETDRGFISCRQVISMVAGSTPRITEMVGLSTPIEIYPLQACVTEPVKPFMDTIVVSGSLHVYVSQSSRGELVMGASVDPSVLHSTRSSFDFTEGLADKMLDLFPFVSRLNVMRQWAGMSDITPDFAPIMGVTPVKGFYLDAGWGTWGFKATPVSGKTMAWTLAHERNHELIEPFRLSRFADFDLVGEKGAASVGH
ncbi:MULTISPECIES: FAD-dependent oxidoreductase [Nitrincola]|uniref:Sarcosine oxidase subunit beta n=1 Tax=Nitrincola nitratireducens TaxID=1229521 RepID=W9UWT2_9GAMM|nr:MULTISPECIES: FAD-dependent oxidoreductase [Nitrincola]EXJ11703.1 Sarcosine oxidase subunit beta [Nitrincola nitratireducens]